MTKRTQEADNFIITKYQTATFPPHPQIYFIVLPNFLWNQALRVHVG